MSGNVKRSFSVFYALYRLRWGDYQALALTLARLFVQYLFDCLHEVYQHPLTPPRHLRIIFQNNRFIAFNVTEF